MVEVEYVKRLDACQERTAAAATATVLKLHAVGIPRGTTYRLFGTIVDVNFASEARACLEFVCFPDTVNPCGLKTK